MATELPPNESLPVELSTTLIKVTLFNTWLLIWSAEGEDVYIVTGTAAEGDAVPAGARPIPRRRMPFPFDVSPYGGTVFIAATAACSAVLEGRE